MQEKKYDIRGFTKPIRYKFGELSNKTLGDLLSIFFERKIKPDGLPEKNIIPEFRVDYFDELSKRNARFIIDYYFVHEQKKIAFEYDGPEHYNNVNKIERDERKKRTLSRLGFEVISVPYYIQLTKDIAKYLFLHRLGVYTEKKYIDAVETIYGTSKEELMLAPGWHTTPETPANFVEKGIERFLFEVSQFPESLRCQLVHSLNLYISRSNGKGELIIPSQNVNFNTFLSHDPKPENLVRFFCSDT